jgi:hypothetical protein
MLDNNTPNNEQTREAMLTVNERQKRFYETYGDNLNEIKTGLAIRLWGEARRQMMSPEPEIL